MTVVKTAATLESITLAVPLPRYAQLVSYSECQFFGVGGASDSISYACREIWSLAERKNVEKYLREAQDEIETEVNYPLTPTWYTSESYPYANPLKLRRGQILAAGIEATSTISAGAAVDHSSDPAVVGPVATAVTDEDEIRVYHPDSDVEVIPSDISISGGAATIQIPRCRLVAEASANNPESGWSYTETGAGGPFEQTVDVKRVYNDASTNATLVWPHQCSVSCSATGCSEYTQTACMYLRSARLGLVDLVPATYSGGTWTRKTACCRGNPELVRVNYRAGLETLTLQAEDAIMRLAHAKMPDDPCGCDQIHALWARDSRVPEILTAERLNCKFGLSDGAWIAYQFAQSMELLRGGIL